MIRKLSVDEIKRVYMDAWWHKLPLSIEDCMIPYLSDEERSKLRRDLEEWVATQNERIQQIEAETDWEKLWKDINSPKIQAEQPPLPIWQRMIQRGPRFTLVISELLKGFLPLIKTPIRKGRAVQRATLAGALNKTLARYSFCPLRDGVAITATIGEGVYQLPVLNTEDLTITTEFIPYEREPQIGDLALRFQSKEEATSLPWKDALKGIQLQLSTMKGRIVQKRRLDANGSAVFKKVGLRETYRFHFEA